jgi:hypothetical protein
VESRITSTRPVSCVMVAAPSGGAPANWAQAGQTDAMAAVTSSPKAHHRPPPGLALKYIFVSNNWTTR